VIVGFTTNQLDSKETLCDMQEYLADYGIEAKVSRLRASHYLGKMWQLQIRKLESCIKLAELLEPLEWHTIKRKSFDVWREVLVMKGDRPERSKTKLLRIAELLKDSNRGNRRKINYDYVINYLLDDKAIERMRMKVYNDKNKGVRKVYKRSG
jgi:hypothetical protein